jgi:hypothetical protein
MPSCPRCGAENPAGKAACWSCFAPMSARADQFREAAAERVVESEAPARSGKKIVIGVVVVAVLAALVYFLILAKPSPAASGRKYLEAVKAGDVAGQEQYSTAAAMSREKSGVSLLRMLAGRGAKPTGFAVGPVAEPSGAGRTLDAELTFAPQSASVIATAPIAWRERLRSGGTIPVQLTLVAEGKGWKVDDVTIGGAAAAPMPVPPGPTGAAPGASDQKVPTEGYVGSILTKVYHLPTCPKAPTGRTAKVFKTKEEAEDAGFRPCTVCNP